MEYTSPSMDVTIFERRVDILVASGGLIDGEGGNDEIELGF